MKIGCPYRMKFEMSAMGADTSVAKAEVLSIFLKVSVDSKE